MRNLYHIPIFVYTDAVFALERHEIPDGPPPLLILDVIPGSGMAKLSFGSVEGLEISLKGFEDAVELAKKVNTGEIRTHA